MTTRLDTLGGQPKPLQAEMKTFLKDFMECFENPIPSGEKTTLQIDNENYKFDENTHYKKFQWNKNNQKDVVQEEEAEGKVYKTFADGSKEIRFNNGAVKYIMADGYIIGKYIYI